MICNVFRPKRGGKTGRVYRGRFRLDVNEPIRSVSLHTTDKRVAEKRLRDLVTQLERERAGLAVPARLAAQASRPLVQYVTGLVADARARHQSRDHVRHINERLSRLLKECGWQRASDITAESFEHWRAEHPELKGKTKDEYLSAARLLTKRLLKLGLFEADPLGKVERVGRKLHRAAEKRALSDAELRALVKGPRGLVYLAAAQTGLRRNELRQLRWADVHAEGDRPHIALRASTTKGKRGATQWITAELAAALGEAGRGKSPDGLVFAGGMPTPRTVKADFKAAGVVMVDALGRRACFHGLRKTFGTNLARGGVSPRIAQELMRHQDIRQTMGVYTDLEALPIRNAVEVLPRLLGTGEGPDAQLDAQSGAGSGHVGAKAVASRRGSARRESAISPHELPGPAAPGRKRSGAVDEWSRGESNPRAGTVRATPLRVCPIILSRSRGLRSAASLETQPPDIHRSAPGGATWTETRCFSNHAPSGVRRGSSLP